MPGFFESIAYGKSNRQLLAAWVIDGEAAGAKALFVRQGEGFSQICREEAFPEELAGEIPLLAASRNSGLSSFGEGILERGGSRVFLEQITEGRKLVVCGAGHVALFVIRLGIMLGFTVTVIEDREEFAEKATEAGAHRVICRPFAEALDEIPGDLSTAFVIMTRAHAHDVDCLRKILRKPYVYAGMMGSRSRSETIRRQLLEEGYDALRTEQVHMPIGLPIGARTPEEIAVSVMAQLVQVMNAADTGEGFPAGMPEELAALERGEEPGAPEGAETERPVKAAPEGAGKTEKTAGILAMIVEKSGEAPRRPGTKMLVRRDGSFLGTVGGGYAEAEILRKARGMLQEGSRESRLVRISMIKGAMYCGGEITVFLLPL